MSRVGVFWSVVAVLAVVAVLPCKHASLDVLAGHEAWLRENIDEHSLLSWSRYAGVSEREAVSSRRRIQSQSSPSDPLRKTTMNDKLSLLLEKIHELEQDLVAEIRKKEEEFSYEVRDRKAHFTAAVVAQHKKLARTIANYVRGSSVFNILTSPLIWIVLVPVVLLHITASVFQWFCFPVYGIPKVRRSDYVVMDRRVLKYLNPLERLNCGYCEYANGVLAYVQEIAGRSEQYWCPIKHAVGLKSRHSRYSHFLDFGDAEEYRLRVEQVRRDFQDIQKDE